MKIGKYIIEIVPKDSVEHDLSGLPINNNIFYKMKLHPYELKDIRKIERENFRIYGIKINLRKTYSISCKHIKPNSGIRYSILGKYWIFLVIKQLN